jgi:hypothetical protein
MTDSNKLNEIAQQAERDANTYNSKTGAARRTGLDEDSGVNTASEQKFPGSKVVYGEGLTQYVYVFQVFQVFFPPSEPNVFVAIGY